MKYKKKAAKIAMQYNVKVKYFYNNTDDRCSANAVLEKSFVKLNTFMDTKAEFFSALFHEIGHIHCYRNNIWPIYHRHRIETHKLLKGFILTAYKAECWIEKWAKNEMKKHFPDLKYHIAYRVNDKKQKKILFEYYKPWIEETNIYLRICKTKAKKNTLVKN